MSSPPRQSADREPGADAASPRASKPPTSVPRRLTLVPLLLAAGLGVIFLVAGVLKLIDIEPTRDVLIYSTPLGSGTARTVATTIASIEVFLGVMLLSGWHRRDTLQGTLLLLGAFTIFLTYIALDPQAPDCSCLGALRMVEDTRINNAIGVGRNIALLAVGLIALRYEGKRLRARDAINAAPDAPVDEPPQN